MNPPDYKSVARIALKRVGELQAPPPLALYVHLPWCVRKCPYCDFNSHAVRGDLPEARYLDALARDLEGALPSVWGREVGSIFIGGGTPSLFSAEGIDRLLQTARMLLRVSPLAEVTLEANPGTFEAARFRAYRDAGVNRLSLGVQSFAAQHLRALGRIHDAREAIAAAETAAGLFDEVNLDLMYALPGQTLAQARADVDQALALAPTHLSVYHLTLEPNTPFAAEPPPLPDDDLAADMQQQLEERLGEAGYHHYETSAFARPGHECRHNLNYWTFGDYLGVGAGAHAKISAHDRIERAARTRHPRAYMDALAAGDGGHIASTRVLEPADRLFEFMMNALRLDAGFDLALFERRTGLPARAAEAGLAAAQRRGLIEREGDRIRPSAVGRRFLNDLLREFLP